MNASEARNKRKSAGFSTLSSRLRKDPKMAQLIDQHLDELRLEQQFRDAMADQHISNAELARRTKSKPTAVSRDLSGGLSSAKLGRVREMAAAVDRDVVTLLLPRDVVERKKAIRKLTEKLAESV
jgi:hypothetical protein